MKEFIIKDDPIKNIFEKKGIEDFNFLTNDTNDNVRVEKSFGGFRGISMRHVIDKRDKKEIIYSDAEVYDRTHHHYLEYLDDAYSGDYGIVIRPDFIWFTILCEISSIIKNDPENFRKYFSKSEEKQNISIHSYEIVPPVDEFLEEVMKRIPSNITENLIVPKFTTLDEKSEFAFKCAFLDTVSPFYNYGVLWCGYNKIKVLGEKSDYLLIGKTLKKLTNIIPELKDYYDKCKSVIDDIISNWDDVEFWKTICKTESGYGERIIDGWFKRFYLKDERDLDKYPKHCVKIDYTKPGNEYTMYVGILSSKLEDGYLIPDFNKIIAKKIKE